MIIVSNYYIVLSIETCVSIDGVAIKGQEFRWIDAMSNMAANVNSCRYIDTGTHFISQEIPFSGEILVIEMSLLFIYFSKESPPLLNNIGLWNFRCTDGNLNGTVSVVPGLHIISVTANVPKNCYAIGVGDVVLWLDGDNRTCQKNITVENDFDKTIFTSNLTSKLWLNGIQF